MEEKKQSTIVEMKQIKKLEEGVYHDGDKHLYEEPPDEQWDCLCLKCDKDLILHLTRVMISGSVLAFCMVQLANGKGDSAFYSSTLSLILGAFLSVQSSNNSNNKKD